MPSFYELLQTISRLRFDPAPGSAPADDPPPTSTTTSPPGRPTLPVAERFARKAPSSSSSSTRQPILGPSASSARNRGSLATLATLGEGTETVSPEQAALLLEISGLLQQRWDRGTARVTGQLAGGQTVRLIIPSSPADDDVADPPRANSRLRSLAC